MSSMFIGCRSLSYLDLSGFDTSSVTNMRRMFFHCPSLTSLDLSGFNTSAVTSTGEMFYNCRSLSYLDLSSFNTSAVTSMDEMFRDCTSLSAVALSGFDASSVRSMDGMFNGCSSLASLDLSGFDTSSVTNMAYMFSDCSSLASLDLSGFDTSSVTNMAYMFYGCSSLASLDLSGFDTSFVTGMRSMFSGCSSLVSLDLSGFKTSSVTNMSGMFYGCSSLASLDLSDLDTSSIANTDDISSLLNGCSGLKTVALGSRATGFPLPEYEVNGRKDWYSLAEEKWFTSAEIQRERNGISDTYIKPRSVSDDVHAQLDTTHFDYDGSSKKPRVSLDYEGKSLVEGKDYTIEYPANSINPGLYHVVIAGQGIYYDRVEIEYEIAGLPIEALSLDVDNFIYDGIAKHPGVAVRYRDKVLTEGIDYDVSCPDAVDVGIHEVTVTGRGIYSGVLKACFDVVPAEIDDTSLDSAPLIYDSEAKCPNVTVTCGGKTLIEGIDYEVSWPADCISVGAKTVTVIGKGNYTGKLETTYEVLPASITSISLSESEFIHDGKEHKPALTVKSGSVTLVEGIDYEISWPTDCASIGTKKITVTGKGNYVGTKEASYAIALAKYAFCELSGSTLVVRGSGEVTAKDLSPVLSSSAKRNQITSVVFSEGITGTQDVRETMFGRLENLTSVHFPSTFTHVGNRSFYNCGNLNSVVFSSDKTEIGAYAFSRCPNLGSIDIKACIIGESAFQGCDSLSSVKAGFNLKTIGDRAFASCPMLTSVELNEGLETIGDDAFQKCEKIETVVLPASLDALGDSAFSGCADNLVVEFLGDIPSSSGTFSVSGAESIIYPFNNATWTKEARKALAWPGTTFYMRKEDGSLAKAPIYCAYETVEVPYGSLKLEFIDAEVFENNRCFDFTVPTDRKVRIEFDYRLPCYHGSYSVTLLNSVGETIYSDIAMRYPGASELSYDGHYTIKGDLKAGDYHLEVLYIQSHKSKLGMVSVGVHDDEPVGPGSDPAPSDPGTVDPAPSSPDVTDPEPTKPDADSTPSNPGAIDPDPTDSGQVMYRLYNPNSGEHFYTASTVERDAVIAAGWNDEGIGWTAPTSGIQVYRLYNSYAGEHHYTTSEAERDMLVSVGWTWEEGGWFSDVNQAVPLYRAYNPNAFANNHHYTTDWGEFQMLLSVGWKDEGVGWHGVN